MTDFSKRSTQPEWMDDPSVSFDDFRSCLAELARVNVWTLAHRPTLRFLDRLFPPSRRLARPVEIIDIGCGYGDLLRQIAAWARRRDIEVSLTGVDLNPWSRAAAMEVTDPSLGITFITKDAFLLNPPRGVDVVVSSLFTHHLTNERIIEFIQWMEEHARLGWFINDLHRHPFPHQVFGWIAELAALHPFVRHDGPVSNRSRLRDGGLGAIAGWSGYRTRRGKDRMDVSVSSHRCATKGELGMIDTMVIGGGPAGSAVAMRLMAFGREVVLLEKAEEPIDKVCGEFLSAEAVDYLAAFDIDLLGLGAVPIHTVRLCMGSRLAEVRLPFPAVSLSRRVLDEALLVRATIEGAMVRRGTKVNALTREGTMWNRSLDRRIRVLWQGRVPGHGQARPSHTKAPFRRPRRSGRVQAALAAAATARCRARGSRRARVVSWWLCGPAADRRWARQSVSGDSTSTHARARAQLGAHPGGRVCRVAAFRESPRGRGVVLAQAAGRLVHSVRLHLP